MGILRRSRAGGDELQAVYESLVRDLEEGFQDYRTMYRFGSFDPSEEYGASYRLIESTLKRINDEPVYRLAIYGLEAELARVKEQGGNFRDREEARKQHSRVSAVGATIGYLELTNRLMEERLNVTNALEHIKFGYSVYSGKEDSYVDSLATEPVQPDIARSLPAKIRQRRHHKRTEALQTEYLGDNKVIYRLIDDLVEEVGHLKTLRLAALLAHTDYAQYINTPSPERIVIVGQTVDTEHGAQPITPELIDQVGAELPAGHHGINPSAIQSLEELNNDAGKFMNGFFTDIETYSRLPRGCAVGEQLKPGELHRRPTVDPAFEEARSVIAPQTSTHTYRVVPNDDGQPEVYFLNIDEDGQPSIDFDTRAMVNAMNVMLDESHLKTCIADVQRWASVARWLTDTFRDEKAAAKQADEEAAEEYISFLRERLENDNATGDERSREQAYFAKWADATGGIREI